MIMFSAFFLLFDLVFFSNLKEKLLWNHFFVGVNVRKVANMFLFHGGVISLVASSGQF